MSSHQKRGRRTALPTAHEGKTAASCSIPAITVVANKAAARAAVLNKRMVKFAGNDAFAIMRLKEKTWAEFDQSSQDNLIL